MCSLYILPNNINLICNCLGKTIQEIEKNLKKMRSAQGTKFARVSLSEERTEKSKRGSCLVSLYFTHVRTQTQNKAKQKRTQ